MRHNKYLDYATVLLITFVFISCAQKEAIEPTPPTDTNPVSENENQTDSTSVLEQITTKDSKSDSIEEESKEITARTFPAPETIKTYEPDSKEDTWFLVGGVTGERAYSVFVDPETIINKDGLINSWSKLEFEETQRDEDGLSYNEVLIASDVDCENRTYSYTDSKFYDALGRLVESQRTPYEPAPIVDGTVSAKIADFVCGYDLNRPK